VARSLRTGISLFPTEEQRVAAIPLFDSGLVGALEWTVDIAFDHVEPLPHSSRPPPSGPARGQR
jgi:hypothetical protein